MRYKWCKNVKKFDPLSSTSDGRTDGLVRGPVCTRCRWTMCIAGRRLPVCRTIRLRKTTRISSILSYLSRTRTR